MGDIDPGQDASGHRARLRKRLLEQGPDSLGDHEVLEFLLMTAIPRTDTKPHARLLLKAFGSYGAVITAEPAALMKIKGIGEAAVAAIKIAEAAAIRLRKSDVMERPVLSNWQALIDYLHVDMAHRAIERVRALHLNSGNFLIRDDLVAEGTVDQAPVYVREIIRRALDLGSVALILVHNHPSGDPQPSRADIALTRELMQAGKPLGITVHDHVIIGAQGHSSMRAKGLI